MVNLKLIAKLTDIYGNPLSGKEIIFYYSLDGTNYAEITRSLTDPNGEATATYTYTGFGTIWFKAVFLGDPDYEGSEAVVKYELPFIQMIMNILGMLWNIFMMLLPLILAILFIFILIKAFTE